MWISKEPPYRLQVEDRAGYLYALIQADEDSFELSLAAVTELAAICRARKTSRLLVEHDIPSKLSTFEVYTIGTQLPLLFQGVEVGFVVHHSSIPDNPRFLEHVARNRGGKGQLFNSAREAEEWLLSRR